MSKSYEIVFTVDIISCDSHIEIYVNVLFANLINKSNVHCSIKVTWNEIHIKRFRNGAQDNAHTESESEISWFNSKKKKHFNGRNIHRVSHFDDEMIVAIRTFSQKLFSKLLIMLFCCWCCERKITKQNSFVTCNIVCAFKCCQMVEKQNREIKELPANCIIFMSFSVLFCYCFWYRCLWDRQSYRNWAQQPTNTYNSLFSFHFSCNHIQLNRFIVGCHLLICSMNHKENSFRSFKLRLFNRWLTKSN